MSETPADKHPLLLFLESLMEFGDVLTLSVGISAYMYARGGWSAVPLERMSADESQELVNQLLVSPEEELESKLDTAVFEYFRRDDYAPLSQLVDAWFRFEYHRRLVFEDALWTHKQGRYTLSIPALAAQFEGIVREEVNDYSRGFRWIAVFLDTLEHYRDKPPFLSNRDDFVPWFVNLEMQERMNEADKIRKYSTLVRIQELFDEKNFADPQSFSMVNRHVVLHGITRNFEEPDSLRLFFILDLLHEALRLYKEAADKTPNDA